MQVQIRNPIAVEVDAADDKGSVSFHFFTAAEHQAVVTIGRDLLPDLIEQLEAIVTAEAKPQAAAKQPILQAEAKPAPQPVVQAPAQALAQPAMPSVKQPIKPPASRDFALFERTMPLAKPKEPARDHQPAHQPILRALLQA